jgi:transposase
MDGRQQRGMQIAANGGAKQDLRGWRVDSQLQPGRRYRVNPMAQSCTCPDFEDRNQPCKHVYAVLFVMTAEQHDDGTVTTTAQKVTYSQHWSTYNEAQVNEKDTFVKLLADLCSGIPQPPQATGRPRLPLGDMVFAAVYKVYCGFSSRRFQSDLRDAHAKGLISRVPHFNSVTNYMADEDLTALLHELIVTSAIPLRALESDFAVDSTGFTTSRFIKWLDEKHGIGTDGRHRKEWVKAHVMVGTRTNVVTSVELSDWKGGDTVYFPALVQTTAKSFDVAEVSADKAYLTKSNVDLVEQVGATPYIPFKKNTKPVLNVGTAWERMYHRFASDPEGYASHYHRRSNVETTFSMIKGKFGDSLMSKSAAGQANEVLCKVLAHNIVCVAQAAIEYGINPALPAAS